MATVALLCALSLLLGIHVGATWPWLAFLARHPSRVQEANMTAPTEPTPTDPTTEPTRTSRDRRQLIVLTWMLIGTMAGGFVLGVLLVVQRAQLAESTRHAVEYQRCQADYTQAFREAYQARADASIASTEALDDVLKAVSRSLETGDPALFATAVQNYLDVRRSQTRERTANPLPPLPEQVCGPAPTED